jgi:hypothetical protein
MMNIETLTLPLYLCSIIMICVGLIGLLMYKNLVIEGVYGEITKYFRSESDDYKKIVDEFDGNVVSVDKQNKLVNGYNIIIVVFSTLFILIFFLDYIFNLQGLGEEHYYKMILLTLVLFSIGFMSLLMGLNVNQLSETDTLVNTSEIEINKSHNLSTVIGIIFVYLLVVGVVFKRGLFGISKKISDMTTFDNYKFYDQIFFIILVVVTTQGILFVFKKRVELSNKIIEDYGDRVIYTMDNNTKTINNLNTNNPPMNNNNYYGIIYVLLMTFIIIYFVSNHFGNDGFNIITSLNKINEYTGVSKIKFIFRDNTLVFSMVAILIFLELVKQ